jgi:hypothetical protein
MGEVHGAERGMRQGYLCDQFGSRQLGGAAHSDGRALP